MSLEIAGLNSYIVKPDQDFDVAVGNQSEFPFQTQEGGTWSLNSIAVPDLRGGDDRPLDNSSSVAMTIGRGRVARGHVGVVIGDSELSIRASDGLPHK